MRPPRTRASPAGQVPSLRTLNLSYRGFRLAPPNQPMPLSPVHIEQECTSLSPAFDAKGEPDWASLIKPRHR